MNPMDHTDHPTVWQLVSEEEEYYLIEFPPGINEDDFTELARIVPPDEPLNNRLIKAFLKWASDHGYDPVTATDQRYDLGPREATLHELSNTLHVLRIQGYMSYVVFRKE